MAEKLPTEGPNVAIYCQNGYWCGEKTRNLSEEMGFMICYNTNTLPSSDLGYVAD